MTSSFSSLKFSLTLATSEVYSGTVRFIMINQGLQAIKGHIDAVASFKLAIKRCAARLPVLASTLILECLGALVAIEF